MRSTSNEAAIAAAIEGLGIARLLSYQVAAHLRSGALVPVLAACETADLPIHVLHHGGRRATQRVRGFIDLVVEGLRACVEGRACRVAARRIETKAACGPQCNASPASRAHLATESQSVGQCVHG